MLMAAVRQPMRGPARQPNALDIQTEPRLMPSQALSSLSRAKKWICGVVSARGLEKLPIKGFRKKHYQWRRIEMIFFLFAPYGLSKEGFSTILIGDAGAKTLPAATNRGELSDAGHPGFHQNGHHWCGSRRDSVWLSS